MSDGRVVIDVILDDGTVTKGVANIDRQLGGLKGSGERAALGIGKIVTALGLVALARKGIDLVRNSLQTAFQRIDTMEQFERVMKTMIGDTDKVNRVLETTRDIVTGTAYTLDGAARSVQNFVTRGIEVEKATKYLEAWGDAVAFYGDGSQAQFDNVNDALATMVTKGKVDMQQLNRLFDAGIPAVEIYASAVGESAADVQDALSNGEISAEDFIDTVSKAMMEGTETFPSIAGAAKEAGATWGAVFSNMRTHVATGVENIIKKIDEMLEQNGLPDMRTMVKQFGESFRDTLNRIAERIPEIVDKIKEFKESLEPWLPIITPIALVIGSFITALATLNSVVRVAQGVWAAFNLILSANPFILIIAAVIALAVAIYFYWDEIKEFTINTWNTIREFFVGLWESIVGVFETAYEWLNEKTGGAFGIYVETIRGYMEMILGIITDVWDWVKDTFSNALDFLKALVTLDFKDMKDAMKNQMENSRELLSNIWERIKTFIEDYLKKIWNAVKEKFEQVKQSISDKINEAKTALINRFTEMVTNARNKATEIVNTARQKFREVVNRIKERMREAVQEVARRIGEMPGKVRDKASQMFSAGKDLVQGLINGIKNMGRNAIEAITGVVGGVIDKAKNLLKISSPSRIFEEFGQALSEGLSVGIEDGTRKAVRSTENLAHGVTRAFSADVGLQNRLRGASLPLSRMVPAFATPATAEVRAILSSPREEQKVVIHPSVVLMDGREVGRIVWEPVKEEIDRDANIKERFRG